jgi:hypothetical protein
MAVAEYLYEHFGDLWFVVDYENRLPPARWLAVERVIPRHRGRRLS